MNTVMIWVRVPTEAHYEPVRRYLADLLPELNATSGQRYVDGKVYNFVCDVERTLECGEDPDGNPIVGFSIDCDTRPEPVLDWLAGFCIYTNLPMFRAFSVESQEAA